MTAAVLFLFSISLTLMGCEADPTDQKHSDDGLAVAEEGFASFISPDQLVKLRESLGDDLIIVDARDREAYDAGHIAGAISLPGGDLRTPSAKPGKGDSQYIFLTPEGEADVQRYEAILGEAGITREHTVVVYGNHGGKRDGSIPAMILDWLGQERVYFLDGKGYDRWLAAGHAPQTEAVKLKPARYEADPDDAFLWSLADVQQHLKDNRDGVVFYDTRSLAEYTGEDSRRNRRGGHIPDAVHADYADLLAEDKQVKSRSEIEAIFAKQGLPEAKAAGKPIVMYCQTSTRVSLPYLILKDLGYDNIAVYDASWHEYGNLDETEIVTPLVNSAD
jgi:thiosulfate/3-mercaptopyruvate sulfurtransferase